MYKKCFFEFIIYPTSKIPKPLQVYIVTANTHHQPFLLNLSPKTLRRSFRLNFHQTPRLTSNPNKHRWSRRHVFEEFARDVFLYLASFFTFFRTGRNCLKFAETIFLFLFLRFLSRVFFRFVFHTVPVGEDFKDSGNFFIFFLIFFWLVLVFVFILLFQNGFTKSWSPGWNENLSS